MVLLCTICLIPHTAWQQSVQEEAKITELKTNEDLVEIATTTPPVLILSVRDQVAAKFGTSSVMLKIASCESGHRQFDKGGTVLRGKQNPKDVGIFQINEKYHLVSSKKMGIDIYTVEGNIEYAAYLYKANGTRDWNASRPNWIKGECKTS